MLLLDEPFGALDAFTREELWCILRDLWTAQRFNVILVTHDLREAVFLADTVYVMSKRPGQHPRQARDRPAAPARARGHLHDEFADIVLELREHIGAMRKPAAKVAMKQRKLRTLVAVDRCCAVILVLWELICRAFQVSDFIFPRPRRSWHRCAQYAGPITGHALADVLGHDGRLRLAIVVGVLLGFLIGSSRLVVCGALSADGGLQRIPKAAFVPILVVWFGIGTGPRSSPRS